MIKQPNAFIAQCGEEGARPAQTAPTCIGALSNSFTLLIHYKVAIWLGSFNNKVYRGCARHTLSVNFACYCEKRCDDGYKSFYRCKLA